MQVCNFMTAMSNLEPDDILYYFFSLQQYGTFDTCGTGCK